MKTKRFGQLKESLEQAAAYARGLIQEGTRKTTMFPHGARQEIFYNGKWVPREEIDPRYKAHVGTEADMAEMEFLEGK